jgi:hypothetical protein
MLRLSMMLTVACSCAAIDRILNVSSSVMLQGPASVEYVFQQDLKLTVGFLRRGYVHIGRLDAEGNFIEDRRMTPILHPKLPRISGLARQIEMEEEFLASISIINDPKQVNEIVYEYRSGRLIKGNLTDEGSFVPTVGERTILFTDYQYRPGAIRIYNLPGKFIPKPRK